jgi:branched-chain amino acid transport system substrate-binding protein
VLPQTTLHDQGFMGKVYQTHGAALPDFLKLGGKKVEGTVLAASAMLVLDQVPDSHPSKKIAAGYVASYEKLYGSTPATFGANVYDAGLLLQAAVPQALKAGKPGTKEFRAGLRDALEKANVVATHGVFVMNQHEHNGLDNRARVMVRIENDKWILAK